MLVRRIDRFARLIDEMNRITKILLEIIMRFTIYRYEQILPTAKRFYLRENGRIQSVAIRKIGMMKKSLIMNFWIKKHPI